MSADGYFCLIVVKLHILRYKYVFNVGDRDELYDLEADPYEMVNLINDQAMSSVIKECRRRLLKWIRKTEDSSIAYAAQCMLSDS